MSLLRPLIITACLIALSAVASGCGGRAKPHEPMAGKTTRRSQGNLADWRPEDALKEAERDVHAGSIKIYLTGTIGLLPTGIDRSEYPLVAHLPRVVAGEQGCTISGDGELRRAQQEYALLYNRYVVEKLRTTR